MSNGFERRVAAADSAAARRDDVSGVAAARARGLGAHDPMTGPGARADVRGLAAALSEPGARMFARINETSTRLHAALRSLHAGGTPRVVSLVELLERRGLLAASPVDVDGGGEPNAAGPAIEAPLVAVTSRPSVTSTAPGHLATGVFLDTFISANLAVPSGGIDPATLNASTVKLYRTADGQPVATSINTSAGGDVLALGPAVPLAPHTEYAFEVTGGLRDVSGQPFVPFVAVFRTGTATSAGDSSLRFDKFTQNVPRAAYTGITKGPDGRLYAAVETGEIVRFDIRGDGTLHNAQIIRTLQDAYGGEARLLTGIEFDPASTANDLVLWVTHSHYALENGPDWTGKVTRLSGPDLRTYQDYVVGLPRSTRDHVTNQLKFGPDGAIYIPQAGNTAMGAPDYAWHYRPERLLSAAILRLDVGLARDRLAAGQGPVDVMTEDGGAYNPNAPGAPLTIYATGVRNAYDLLWHSNGSLYAPMNGSQRGGATPAGPGVPGIGFVEQVEDDFLFRIEPGGYYGHPNPARGQFVRNGGNPTAAADPFELAQYPVGTLPDANYRQPVFTFGQHYSPNGVIEYRGQAFGGTLEGKILVARYSGGDDVIVLTVNNAGQVVEAKSGIEGLKNFNDPVDLTEDRSTGNLYVAEFGARTITLVRPTIGGQPPGDAAPPNRAPQGPWGLGVARAGKTALELNWTDTVGETGYKIERSGDGVNGWTQVASVGPNVTRYVDGNLTRGRTFFYRVRANSGAGFSKYTAVASGVTPAMTLPDGWTGFDVGAVGQPATGDFRDGMFELAGSGADISGTSDGFAFASVPASGDVEIVARVIGVGSTNAYAKAGVMIRAGTAADAPNAMMELTAAHGAEFQARETAGGSTSHARLAGGGAAPFWVRLVRRGDVVSGYASADGENWTRVGLLRAALGEHVLVGLAVTSHDNAALCTATFDNVRVNAPAPLAPPDAPVDLAAAVGGTARVDLTWRDTSLDETGFVIERRRGPDGPWQRIATVGPEMESYADEYLAGQKQYDYRVIAINVAGASAASNEVQTRTPRVPPRPQTPFGGTPINLPATIEAEAFDDGAKGKAWKDRTPDNDLAAFRDSGVEIDHTSDPAGGRYHVVAAKGEWVEYTVNVPATGLYTLELRLAAADGFGAAMSIVADGRRALVGGASLGLPATGGWDAWRTAAGSINLRAGVQVIRLSFDGANDASGDVARVNWMKITPAAPSAAPSSAPQNPAKGRPRPRAARLVEAIFNPA